MKFVITGHTSGLGNACYEYFKHDHQVTGLSRSNDYDLSRDLEMFVSTDFDVYINNAYYEFAQTELLYRLFEENKYRECMIINIGSVSADGNKDTINRYAIHKASLEKACNQLQLIDSNCKVIHIKLGRINTPMTDHRSNYPRIEPSYIVDVIDWIIQQPRQILIKNITVDIMHSRKEIV
jgi:NADP-dependent 3-hydroxy acid dehydrogenase YdfG